MITNKQTQNQIKHKERYQTLQKNNKKHTQTYYIMIKKTTRSDWQKHITITPQTLNTNTNEHKGKRHTTSNKYSQKYETKK